MTKKSIDAVNAASGYLALLADRGIDYLFANAGTDFAPIIEAMSLPGAAAPTPITVPHENVAVSMAHGYTMVTGRPQAVMVHVSVGTANALCGLMNASRAQVPMLFTAGRTPITEAGAAGSRDVPIHWPQEMYDQAGMVRELVKWDYELRTADQIETVIDRALNITMSEPRGPVYLSLPREVLGTQMSSFEFQSPSRRQVPSPPHPDPEAVGRAAEILAAAENPLIITTFAGRDGGVVAELATLADRFALPVVNKWLRALSLPSDHPMHLGFDPDPLLAEADVILVLESDVPWVPSYQAPPTDATVIHFGVDPLFENYPIRGFTCDLAVTGVLRASLPLLSDALAELEPRNKDRIERRRARIGEFRNRQRAGWAETLDAAAHEMPIHPAWLSHCIDRVKDDDTIVIKESPLLLEHMTFNQPLTLFYGLGAGGLGWGQGAALGAKLAAPDRLVICTQGDGTYMFGSPVSAHAVGAAYDLPVLTIVFNNRMWGAVRQATRTMYPDGHAARANPEPLTFLDGAPNLERAVEVAGGYGERVEDPKEVPAALDRALHAVNVERRAAVLNVITKEPARSYAGDPLT